MIDVEALQIQIEKQIQRIAMLEDMVERMKNCDNCKYFGDQMGPDFMLNPEKYKCGTCDGIIPSNWELTHVRNS